MTTGTDLIEAMRAAMGKREGAPAIGRPVIYVSRRVRDVLWFDLSPIGRAVKHRIVAKRRRGPRLRDLVRSPAKARQRLANARAPSTAHVANWIAKGRPPWMTEADVPPELRDARFVQRSYNGEPITPKPMSGL